MRPVTAKDWRNVALLAIAAVVGLLPAIFLGHIVGHSSALNVNWAEGFAGQVGHGILLPRWLPEMTAGAGSAVFYFYGPLPFYVATPFVALTGNGPLSIILVEMVLLAGSGIAAYALLRHFAGEKAALIAALIYVFLPYHFATDIWFRAAFAEQASFVFIPLCVLGVLRLPNSNTAAVALALAFACQIISHLATTLLLAPVLVVLVLAMAGVRRDATVIFRAAVAAILGTGLAAFYVWPALTLQGMIQPGFWQMEAAADNLLFGPKATQDLSLFMVPLAIELCALFVLAIGALRKGNTAPGRSIGLIALGMLFLISIAAQPLWQVAGIFNRVQFPWRALAIVEVLLAVLLALDIEHRDQWHKTLAGVVMGVFFGFVVAGYSQVLFNAGDQQGGMSAQNDRRDMVLKTDASEYLPSCFSWPAADRRATTHGLAAARAPADAGANAVFYYPFLVATRSGTAVDLACDPATGHAIAADGLTGPLQFTVKTLPQEQMGQWISLASLVALLALAARGLFLRRSSYV